MKINVELNRKSIKDAVKILKEQRKVLTEKMIPEYMQLSADWIINRANEILDRADIGETVKSYIFNAWDTEWVSPNHLKIINHSWKSSLVEFGVGIIGQTSQHPNASNAGYEYNLETVYKFGQGMWSFAISDYNLLDIPQDAIIDESTSNGNTIITTQGTQGVWFLYNAVEDFKVMEQKKLWERIKKKYWS